MALRSESTGMTQPSAIAGLPSYWADASKPHQLECEKWIDLFEVALIAKNNISITELTKTTGVKEKGLTGDMKKPTATKKAISALFLALGIAARKNNCK